MPEEIPAMGIELRRKPTADEVEQICSAAEEAAEIVILAKVPRKRISDFDITVEAVGDKPLALNIDIGLELSIGNEDTESIVKAASTAAFSAAEAKAKELELCVTSRS